MRIDLGQPITDNQENYGIPEFVNKVEEEPRLGMLNEFFYEIPNYQTFEFAPPTGELVGAGEDGIGFEFPQSAECKLLLQPECQTKPYYYIIHDEVSKIGYFMCPMSETVRAFEDVSNLNNVIAFGVAYMRFMINDLFSSSDDLCTPEQFYS